MLRRVFAAIATTSLVVGGLSACGAEPGPDATPGETSSTTTAPPAPDSAEPTPTSSAPVETTTSPPPPTSTPLTGADIAQLVADAAAADGVALSDDTVACIEDELIAEGIVDQVNDNVIDLETAAVSMLACLTEAEYEALIG